MLESNSLVRGAMILAVAGMLSRVMGMAWVILLPRVLTEVGMGLLQMVRPIYYAGTVIAVAGLPVAVSKLVAEKAAERDANGVLRVVYITLLLTLMTGFACSAAIIAGAGPISRHVLKDAGAYLPLIGVAPSILFLALCSALRGAFQGLMQMGPSALSQVVEQFVRVVGTVVLAALLVGRGVEWGAAGAAAASGLGALASFCVLAVAWIPMHRVAAVARQGNGRGSLWNGTTWQRKRRATPEGWSALVQRLVMLAVPVVMGAIFFPLMGLLDTVLVPGRMVAVGFSQTEVRAWFGYLGMASSLVSVPNVLTMAIAASLVPSVADAMARGSLFGMQRRVVQALRVAILLVLPAAVGMYALATPLSSVLFGYPEAAVPLAILAYGSVGLGLYQATTAALQGMGQMMTPVRHLVVGVAVKLVLNYTLSGIPAMGIRGAAWGTVAGFTIAAALNLWVLWRSLGRLIDGYVSVAAPAAGVFAMVPVVTWLYEAVRGVFGPRFAEFGLPGGAVTGMALMGAVACGVVTYGVVVILLGAVKQHDLEAIPRLGPGMANALRRARLLR